MNATTKSSKRNTKPKAKKSAKRNGAPAPSRKANRTLTEFEKRWVQSKVDPFANRSLRVPDGDMECTATTYSYNSFNYGKPYYNTSTNYTHMILFVHPSMTGNSMTLMGNSSATGDFSDNTGGSTAFSTSGKFMCKNDQSELGYPLLSNASFARVAGGGARIKVYSPNRDSGVNVTFHPVFNGDAPCTYFDSAIALKEYSWEFEEDGTILLPFPCRNRSNAYDYVAGCSNAGAGTLDGASAGCYPAQDTRTAGTTIVFKEAPVGIANNSASYNGPSLYSLSTGMGALCFTIILPPGAGIAFESIALIEAKFQRGNAASASVTAEYRAEPSSLKILESTSNVLDQVLRIAPPVKSGAGTWTLASAISDTNKSKIRQVIGDVVEIWNVVEFVGSLAMGVFGF